MTMYLADRDLCPRCRTTVSYSHTVERFGNPDIAYFSCDSRLCDYVRYVEAPVG